MLAPYGTDTYVACAYALENNIIEKDELKYFINEGKLSEAKKIDVPIFIAKAITPSAFTYLMQKKHISQKTNNSSALSTTPKCHT